MAPLRKIFRGFSVFHFNHIFWHILIKCTQHSLQKIRQKASFHLLNAFPPHKRDWISKVVNQNFGLKKLKTKKKHTTLFPCSVFKDTDSLSAKVRSQLLLLPDRTAAQSTENERQREQEEQRQRREGSDPLYSPTRYTWNACSRKYDVKIVLELVLMSFPLAWK